MAARGSHHLALAGRMGRRALLVLVAGWLLVAGIGTANAATVTVSAVNFEFKPGTRTVNVGDVVHWTFAGDPHSVTSGTPGSPDGRFDSGIKDPGAGFQHTFDTAGTFPYFCQIHPEQMTGTIVVKAGPAPTPEPTAKPTARPTATATARPTATVRPTATATATARPTATATARPTATATVRPTAPATAGPIASPTATASATATATASPSPQPAASPVASATGSGTPLPSPTPENSQPTAGVDPLPIVLGVVVLGLVVAGGLALERGSRGTA